MIVRGTPAKVLKFEFENFKELTLMFKLCTRLIGISCLCFLVIFLFVNYHWFHNLP